MEDIYPILAKHFLKDATIEEEALVAEFQRANPKEYQLLYTLWHSKNIKIHEFDPQNAWKRFVSNRSNRSAKVIPLFGNLRRTAAIAAVLIIGAFSLWYLAKVLQGPERYIVENKGNMTLEQKLDDGSVVWLNKGSSISYPKNFDGTTREIKLKGEAFFEVIEDVQHPFVVTADHSTITVLGTAFNVNSDKQHTEVTVMSGKVQVASMSKDTQIVLLPNQSTLATKEGLISRNTIDQNYLSWKTGQFEFRDTPINNVVAKLNTFYRDSLIMDPGKEHDCFLTAKFEQAPLHEVVDIIKITCGLSIKKYADHYKIE